MFSKKTLKTVIAALLALVCTLSLFACGGNGESEVIAENNGQYAIQWENKRYYFKQGCPENWMFTEVDAADKYKINSETGLVCVLAPINGDALTEAEVESTKTTINYPIATAGKTAVEGVEYCIYFVAADNKVAMTDSTEDVVAKIMDEDNATFGFNNVNYRSEPRTAYTQTGEATLFTAKYSKVQFNKVDYTFTKDGDDMKGSFFLVMKGTDYFIITFEAKAELYDTYYNDCVELVGDWRKVGWENAED